MEKFRTIAITGATSGLGKLVAIELVKRDAHLILTARNKERAEATKKMLESINPKAKIDFFFGDLSVMRDVKRVGEEIKAVHPRIDVLVNNAGLHAFEQRVTSDGLAEMMAVNYLAPWLLTNTLLQSLIASRNARIVNVASEASRNHGELKLPGDLTDISEFTSRESSAIYGKTKLLNIMFTAELARRLSGTGIIVNALNPGFNVTGLGRELWFATALERILKFFHIGDPRKGADIILRLSIDAQYNSVTGGYFNVITGNPISPIYPGGDKVMQNKLWSDTETLLKQRGFIE
ncbi:NAD(P)-dependent dehydrogenase (short-subunit alcohol dehydrogenase family) [Clostridium acetobutylicum]|uniref:Short-chain alcohol dehydrogenase family protein n=1 Tax=Clostridium acetobutylicum (strain ATCC 824 / DSM 792 / JCM 1419 / IAM 19013 / LMG 5710 / NBRC 13948 / NRRL B-527 / VKM B-1787 / 2291 / W) TaxID=272562 RepID=Q97DJ3_CLOAB|nr:MULTISPECIES: SDR family NAD(P)-dependent oxidoreductase [Clostridium]AAK81410.1 Short-chain alcohol dehydrogenase family protein [Clostridium acetobutylicum ATCC 824]ADZ22525.1 Short-chain alcohol dehydrogenase family protein [Clostridium acetobutylicum EA 2018]AEI32879.1 Short-chain alcohol dehydrogenase family protein [Clostridium acetobutylicum DSM 1731]AWV80919.1 SDR family NAD(P)-dependent oxidoreductase [Clostridium acetobutylicum]MBC2393755.1 SDR family NAD(P)-dependent oxidoreducta